MQQNREILITEEFYRFSIDREFKNIPSDQTISELIRVPKLDLQFMLQIFGSHEHGNFTKIYPKLNKIDSDMFELNNPTKLSSNLNKILPNSLWDKVAEELKNGDYDPKLYAFFSLLQYRRKIIQKYDRESQTVLKEASDRVISRLITENTNDLLKPTQYIHTLREFCDGEGIKYQDLKYYLNLFAYCSLILPQPMNFIRNINHDSSLLSFFSGEIKKYEDFEIGEIPLAIHHDDNIGEYQKRRNEANKRLYILFSDLHAPRIRELFDLTNLITKKYPDFHIHKFNHESDRLIAYNRERRQSNSAKSEVLCRCEFCYRFRLEPRSSNGNYAWSCELGECKKLYESWKRHLSRVGKGLTHIRKLGF